MEVLWLIVLGFLVLGVALALYEWRKGIKMRYDHLPDQPDKMEADRTAARQSSKDGF
jgi:hypothetical protein